MTKLHKVSSGDSAKLVSILAATLSDSKIRTAVDWAASVNLENAQLLQVQGKEELRFQQVGKNVCEAIQAIESSHPTANVAMAKRILQMGSVPSHSPIKVVRYFNCSPTYDLVDNAKK